MPGKDQSRLIRDDRGREPEGLDAVGDLPNLLLRVGASFWGLQARHGEEEHPAEEDRHSGKERFRNGAVSFETDCRPPPHQEPRSILSFVRL